MSEESGGARGAAAWEAQRATVAEHNLAARKRCRAERSVRERAVELRARAEAARELQQLEELNAAMASRRVGG